MKSSPKPSRPPRCVACGAIFTPEPRAAGRQRFCGKPACRADSKRTSQRRWLKSPTGRTYHTGEAGSHRVQEWRANHPNYWRRKVTEVAVAPVATHSLREIVETLLIRDSCHALQDSCPPYVVAFIGLSARLGGHAPTPALQDTIARDLHEMILEGHAILAALETPHHNGKSP